MINKRLILTSILFLILLIPIINAISIKTTYNNTNEIMQKTVSVYRNVAYAHRPRYSAFPFARV